MLCFMKMVVASSITIALAATLHASLASKQPASTPETSSESGRLLYEQHCAACHGLNGTGDGPAAVWLYPKPRHFNSGLFKIKSTPAGSLPTDEDWFETITRGMPGSSMPSFTYLSEAARRTLV